MKAKNEVNDVVLRLFVRRSIILDHKFATMKTKTCATCQKEDDVMHRVQIQKGKTWIFVCKECCEVHQKKPNYRYGGTWKGYRH